MDTEMAYGYHYARHDLTVHNYVSGSHVAFNSGVPGELGEEAAGLREKVDYKAHKSKVKSERIM
ncbi:hypothetical protein E2C01_062298 [Portunus trituberculatus]|uniref:Uncharacterized protein n=1 Tax=Portunus trituberculatus TaxID=210409 RepID=A0A5B7HDN7_PORTR|nr:hypothetical protein [Portunus trituberculatus]